MKERCLAILTMAAIAVVSSPLLPAKAITIKPGDPGVYQFGGSLYKVVSGPNWYDAQDNAKELGGYLASITTPEEDSFLYNNIVLAQPEVNYGRYLWIGLNDVDNEGAFVWSSGEPFAYNNINKVINSGNEFGQDWFVYWAPDGTWDDQELDGYPYTGFGRRGIAEVPYLNSISAPGPASAPGPLPIFGAAAAFGFSRKLRKRIKSTT